MESEPTFLGDRLRTLMKRREMSGKHLASITGIDPSYVSQLVSGKRETPSAGVAERIAYALGTTIDWLLTGRGEIDLPPTSRLMEGPPEADTEWDALIQSLSEASLLALADNAAVLSRRFPELERVSKKLYSVRITQLQRESVNYTQGLPASRK